MGLLFWVLASSALSSERFLAAKRAYEAGHYEAAVVGFEEVLRAGYRAPEAADALFYLASAYYELGRYSEAGRRFGEFVHRFFDDPRCGAAGAQGISSYLKADDPWAGFELFEGFPYLIQDEGIGVRLAEALTSRGWLDQALKVYNRLGTPQAIFAAAKVCLGAGRSAEGRGLLLGLARADSSWAQPAWALIFFSYLKEGDTLSALELLPDLRPFGRLPPEEGLNLARFLLWLQDLEGAAECCLRALSESRLEPEALTKLATIYRRQGRLGAEAQVLERLSGLDPKAGWVEAELARVRLLLDEEFDRSRLFSSKFLNFGELVQVAEKLLERGLGQDALTLVETIGAPEPDRFLLAARILEALGRYKEARAQYHRYIELSLLGDSVSEALARVRYLDDFLIRDHEAVVERLLTCTTDAERGIALFELSKDYLSAIPYLEGSSEPKARFYLAQAYEFLYRSTGAPEYRERAVAKYEEFLAEFPQAPLTGAARFRKIRLLHPDEPARLEELLHLYPDLWYADSCYYLLAGQAQSLSDSRRWLEELVSRFPGSGLYPSAILWLSRLDLAAGDTAAARERLPLLLAGASQDSTSYLALRILSRIDRAQPLRWLEELLDRFPHPKLEDVERYLELLLAEGRLDELLGYLARHPGLPIAGLFRARAGLDPARALLGLYGLEPNPQVLYYRGEFAHRGGRNGLARQELERLLRLPESRWHPPARLLLTQLSTAEGRFEEAARLYLELFNASPESLPWLSASIANFYRAGSGEMADSLLGIYEELAGRPAPELRLPRLGWLLDENRLDSAQEELDRIQGLESGLAGDDEFVYYQGLLALKKGDFSGVVAQLAGFESRFPTSPLAPHALFKLGTAYYQLGELEPSASSYRAAARDEALRVDALSNLGVVYRELKRLDEAIRVYEELLEIEDLPNRDEFLFRLGYTHLKLGDHRAAVQAFEEALSLPLDRERRCEILHWLGESYLKMGELSKALFQFLKISHLYPDQELWAVTAELKAGVCYELMGRPDKAKGVYEAIVKRRGEGDVWAQEAQKRMANLEE